MAEQEQTTSTEQASSTESLEQVYTKFNVEAEAQQFKPQQRQEQPQQAVAPEAIPDPVLDPNGYKAWVGKQSDFTQKALQQINTQVSALTAERVRSKEDADVKDAVSRFKSIVGDEVDDDVAEIALALKARKDPKFLTVYQKRDQNPAAWRAAVGAYANEYKLKSPLRIDSQIAENQRAAKNSIGSQSKRQEPHVTGDDRVFLDNNGNPLTGTAYDRAWRNYIDRGY